MIESHSKPVRETLKRFFVGPELEIDHVDFLLVL
jgi:hypothetical protein